MFIQVVLGNVFSLLQEYVTRGQATNHPTNNLFIAFLFRLRSDVVTKRGLKILKWNRWAF